MRLSNGLVHILAFCLEAMLQSKHGSTMTFLESFSWQYVPVWIFWRLTFSSVCHGILLLHIFHKVRETTAILCRSS